jgi:hypothetical protein
MAIVRPPIGPHARADHGNRAGASTGLAEGIQPNVVGIDQVEAFVACQRLQVIALQEQLRGHDHAGAGTRRKLDQVADAGCVAGDVA